MIRQYELVEKVRSYDINANEELLNRAYVFSMKAHGNQRRASGDPYFSHPLEVAGILTDLKLDTASIATGLLHDTIEDTLTTPREIKKQFGKEIAGLVDGVTKLSKIEVVPGPDREAENFRKFLLAMSDDIRVLLVKLADRLHNMRTLHHLNDPEKRRRIALETMEIYVPLAERIGVQQIKDELEDLAFAELNPEARETIVTRLAFLREEAGNLRERIENRLKDTLAEQGVEADVLGREKRPYSIWRKMETKHVPFEQLSDILGFRILVKDVETCYRALGVVHQTWSMVPERFKDYISTPKSNHYESIHTTVVGPESRRVEIQIRTYEMHEVAEYGIAAHWQYKQNPGKIDGTQYRWIREMLEILEHGSSPEEFLEHTKLEMYQDKVFCFTPKGDLIALPTGATPVDFAYAVHTRVGDSCVGAKVNGKHVPLRTELRNGDQVEIVRSKAQEPSPTWETFVVSGKARSAIRRHRRAKEAKEYAALGESMLVNAFRQHGHSYTGKARREAVKKLGYKRVRDFHAAVGRGERPIRDVINALFPGEYEAEDEAATPFFRSDGVRADKHAVPIKGLKPGLAVHMASCCYPIPGDRIVGIVTPGKGVTIHTIDCDELENYDDQSDKWVDVQWEKSRGQVHVGRITIVLANEAGAFGEMATTIARNHGNISNVKIVERQLRFFQVDVDIEVRDVKHLANIIAALRVSPFVNSVERLRG